MNLPSAEEYLKIIEKKAPGSLAMLPNHRFVLRKDGKACWHKKSPHAVVFKTESNSRFYAVRFFLYDQPELFERYHQIQNYLANRALSWKVPFEFLDKEYYPATQMDWIDSLSFTEYLDLIITEPLLISKLQSRLVDLSRSLEENGIGHGNLNLSHVRFVKQQQEYILKLIDYDSLYIPSFEGKDSLTVGTASFQHPMRLASDFSERIDHFSFWIFLTALEALKADASLWTKATENGYDKSEQLLFNFRDLAFPQQSRIFQILKGYNSDALNFYSEKLIGFCNSRSLDEIEAPRLYTEEDPRSDQKKEMVVGQAIEKDLLPTEKDQLPANSFSSFLKPSTISSEPRPVKEKIAEDKLIHLKVRKEPEQQRSWLPSKTTKKARAIAFISIAALVVLTSAYFVTENLSPKTETKTVSVPKKMTTPVRQEPVPQEKVFTSSNITQFLFQLYRSYNKRDLQDILSHYGDSVSQYYDASDLTKGKLSDIINDLFIKPAFYECQPDLRTLRFTVQGDRCRLVIGINESLKADANSKMEKYSSTIEYTVDRKFKILAEKNLE